MIPIIFTQYSTSPGFIYSKAQVIFQRTSILIYTRICRQAIHNWWLFYRWAISLTDLMKV